MVYLTHKWKKNRKYLYLEKKARIDGKVKRVFQIYLGPEDKIEERQIKLNINKLETSSYNFASAILWQIAEEIGLRQIINNHTNKKRAQGISVGDYIVISIINRCVQPCSKNMVADWLEDDFLNFLYGDHLGQLDSQGYWNHFQYFTPAILQDIQYTLIKSVLDRFKIKLDLVLYDPTNFVTNQGYHQDNQLAKHGNSKEKRFDKRIVNLSLLTSKLDNIPLWHQAYEGNVHDANHFKSTITKITDFFKFLHYDLKMLTLVFDKGNHSLEAFEYMATKSLGIITSIRKSSHKSKLQIHNREFEFVMLRGNKQVGFIEYDTTFHSIKGILYIIYDRQVKKRSLSIFSRDLKKKRNIIDQFLQTRLNDHKWTKQQNVEKKLKELSKGIPFRKIFQFTIEGEEGELKVVISENHKEKVSFCRQLGKAVIFTNRITWEPQTVIQVYRDKFSIEDSFKQMKDVKSIAIRPMYHYANLSIHVHVFTCVMAYLLNTLARKKLTQHGLDLTIKQFQNYISKLKVTQIGNGQLKQPLLQLNTVDGEAKEIAKIFQLSKIIDKLR